MLSFITLLLYSFITYMLTLLAFIIILGILVLAHELGHFLTARIFGARVHEFGFGFPPRVVGVYRDANNKRKIIWGKKFDSEQAPHTIYSLNAVPIGGFVKIKGENESELKDPDSFGAKSISHRALILSAGVIMNVILCIVLLSIGFGFGIPSVLDDEVLTKASSIRNEQIQIVSVSKYSPAALSGLKIGDAILEIEGNTVNSVTQIQNITHQSLDQTLVLKINRGGHKLTIESTPQILATSNNQPELGVGLVKTGIITYPWYLSIWEGTKATYHLVIDMFVALGQIFKSILSIGEMTIEVAGPVGIAVLTDQMVNLGLIYVLQFAAILSLNLAIINILPIPALDGGRLLFLLIEKIRGKEVNARIENIVHTTGFALLMLLVIFITYKDLARWGGQILNKIF